jgi:hypothetical protein
VIDTSDAEINSGTGSDVTVTVSESGHLLRYSDHWSDPSLSETFERIDGGLEQSLILQRPPKIDRPAFSINSMDSWRHYLPAVLGGQQAEWLASETDLFLLSGDSLWINSRRQTQAFSTQNVKQGDVTIRNAAGETVLTLAPVVAYEADNLSQSTTGFYEGDLLEANIWRLRFVTPWSWWTDPDRSYPAVLDPEVYVGVLNPVTISLEHECIIEPGTSPFADCPRPPANPAENIMVAYGSVFYKNDDGDNQLYATMSVESNVTFTNLPTLPTGASVIGAELVLQGTLVGQAFQLEVVNPANGVVLHHSTLSGVPDQTISVDVPLLADQITPIIEGWRNGGDNHGLVVRPRDVGAMELCNSTTFHDRTEFHLGCGFFGSSGPQLNVLYSRPSLTANHRIDHQPMPSVDDNFDHSQHMFSYEDMDQRWHGVGLVTESDGPKARLNVAGVGSSQNGSKTNFVVYDNFSQAPDNQMATTVYPRLDGSDNGSYALQGARRSQYPTPQTDRYLVLLDVERKSRRTAFALQL